MEAIAELCSNHGGSLERALALVDAACEAGFDAVKLQHFRIDRLFAPEARAHDPALGLRRAWEVPEGWTPVLAARARARGLRFATTPFHLEAVEHAAPHVDFLKVASYQVLDLRLLSAVARTGLPVVLSTGMATWEEVDAAVRRLRGHGARELALLHCVSSYPTPPEEANLACIAELRARHGVPAGWSDHSRSPDVVRRAVRRFGATLVELHLDLDGSGAEAAFGHCWLPGEARALLAELRRPAPADEPSSLPMDGDGDRAPRACEEHERLWRADPSDGLRPLARVRAGLAPARRSA